MCVSSALVTVTRRQHRAEGPPPFLSLPSPLHSPSQSALNPPTCAQLRLSIPSTCLLSQPHKVTAGSKKDNKDPKQQNKPGGTSVRMSPVAPARSWLLLLFLLRTTLAVPSPFQLAPDTPAPAEPAPTRPTPRPDPCEGRPCLNGGLCLALTSVGRPEDTWEYACTCHQGYTGRNCEVRTQQLYLRPAGVQVVQLMRY